MPANATTFLHLSISPAMYRAKSVGVPAPLWYRLQSEQGACAETHRRLHRAWHRLSLDFTFEDPKPRFRATPLAHLFATLFTERNAQADLKSIIYQFEAATKPDPTDHHSRIGCPT
jgi:hypothetical protein